MRSALLLVLALFSASISSADRVTIPPDADALVSLLKAVFDGSAREPSDARVLLYFAELVRLGGSGFRDSERAAFLVLEENGEFGCVLWPKQMAFRKQRYQGRVPAGTIAILHTHPKSQPLPSLGDRREAVRLGIPFVILGPREVYHVAADGGVVSLVKDRAWHTRIPRHGGCKSLP